MRGWDCAFGNVERVDRVAAAVSCVVKSYSREIECPDFWTTHFCEFEHFGIRPRVIHVVGSDNNDLHFGQEFCYILSDGELVHDNSNLQDWSGMIEGDHGGTDTCKGRGAEESLGDDNNRVAM